MLPARLIQLREQYDNLSFAQQRNFRNNRPEIYELIKDITPDEYREVTIISLTGEIYTGQGKYRV